MRAVGEARDRLVRRRWARARAEIGLVVVVVLGIAARASADPPEAGTWRAGATTTAVQVERWDPACGPPPQSSRAEGGGNVQLAREGSAIVIGTRGREVRTGACWSRNPAIRRIATQAGGGVWTTQCQTPQGDPHEEHGRYTLKLLPGGELVYEDASRFHWRLGEATCAAATTTTQTLVRIGDAAAPAAAEPAPGAEPAPVACVPGAAATLAVRPQHARVELGERVCFRASASDAAGCPLPQAPIRWSIAHDEGIAGRLEGDCFVAGERAAEAEGTFRVTATIGALATTAVVQVQAADLSSLLAKRVESAALEGVEVVEPPALAPQPGPPPPPAAKVDPSARAAATRAQADRRVALAAAGGFVLVLIAWMWLVRSRRRREAEQAAAPVAASIAPPARSIAPDAATADAWICPTCRVGYPREVGSCPKDGSELVPWRQFAESRRPSALVGGKRCPRCGRPYDAAAAFCTDDGSSLVAAD